MHFKSVMDHVSILEPADAAISGNMPLAVSGTGVAARKAGRRLFTFIYHTESYINVKVFLQPLGPLRTVIEMYPVMSTFLMVSAR